MNKINDKSKNKSKVNKNKTVKNKVIAKPATAEPVAPVAISEAAPQNAPTKRGKGRPDGTSSQSLVNINDLIAALPPNSQLPLSNRLIRILTKSGLSLPASPFKCDLPNLTKMADGYKTSKA